MPELSKTLPTLSASQARAKLFPLLGEIATKGPIQIFGRHGAAVLVSVDQWNALVEASQTALRK